MFYLGGRYLGRFSEPVQWEPGADAPARRLKGFLLIFLSLWFSASPTVLQARPTLCLYLKLVTLKMPCRMDEMVSPQHIYTLPCFPVIAKDINSIIICLWYHKQKRCTHSYMGKLTLKVSYRDSRTWLFLLQGNRRSTLKWCLQERCHLLCYTIISTRHLVPNGIQNMIIVGLELTESVISEDTWFQTCSKADLF